MRRIVQATDTKDMQYSGRDAEIAKLERQIMESDHRAKAAMTSKRDTPIGELHKAELAKLRRKVAELEKQLLPGQIAVYKAAMRWDEAWRAGSIMQFAEDSLMRH